MHFLQPVVEQHSDASASFFELLCSLFSKSKAIRELLEQELSIEDIIQRCCMFVYERESTEGSPEEQDIGLQGVIQLLGVVLQNFPQKNATLIRKEELVRFLVDDCLFQRKGRETESAFQASPEAIERKDSMPPAYQPPPKCKHPRTRSLALQLLKVLFRGAEDSLVLLLSEYMRELITETTFRSCKRKDWYMSCIVMDRSKTGFVGMKNLGCSCYMNSVNQQLFMMPAFRRAILEVPDRNLESLAPAQNLLHQSKVMFAALMNSEKMFFNPKNFFFSVTEVDGQPLNPNEQKLSLIHI